MPEGEGGERAQLMHIVASAFQWVPSGQVHTVGKPFGVAPPGHSVEQSSALTRATSSASCSRWRIRSWGNGAPPRHSPVARRRSSGTSKISGKWCSGVLSLTAPNQWPGGLTARSSSQQTRCSSRCRSAPDSTQANGIRAFARPRSPRRRSSSCCPACPSRSR